MCAVSPRGDLYVGGIRDSGWGGANNIGEIVRLRDLHFDWARQHHARITRAPEIVDRMAEAREPPGILIAYRDRGELEADGLEMPAHLQ